MEWGKSFQDSTVAASCRRVRSHDLLVAPKTRHKEIGLLAVGSLLKSEVANVTFVLTVPCGSRMSLKYLFIYLFFKWNN